MLTCLYESFGVASGFNDHVRSGTEPHAIICGNAEHLGDDDARQRESKCIDQVHLLFVLDGVEQFVSDSLNALALKVGEARFSSWGCADSSIQIEMFTPLLSES